jgi:hypothetical protein
MSNLLPTLDKTCRTADLFGEIWSSILQIDADIVGVKDSLQMGREIRGNENHDACVLGPVQVWLRKSPNASLVADGNE